MKKKLICLFLLINISTFAQSDEIDGFAGFGAGWTANSFDMSSLNTMLENYNQDYQGEFSPFNTISHGYAYKLTFGARMNHFVFQGTWNYIKTNQDNVFIRTTKYGRAFELNTQDVNLTFGLGYGTNFFRITGDFGMGYRIVDIHSAQIMPDGTRSYGSQNYMNGIFQSGQIPIYFGATVDFKLYRWFHIQLSANTNTIVFEGDGLQGLIDNNSSRGPAYDELPLSHKAMYDDVIGGNFTNTSNYVSGVFQGFQFSASLFINLSFH